MMKRRYNIARRHLLLLALIICCLFGSQMYCEAAGENILSVTVLDVGQGLAVYCECGDHAMLYDGGGRDTASEVVSFLRGRGVKALDYAVVSHYDDDHLAGVIGALHVFDCGLALAPDYVGQTTIYTSFMDLIEKKRIPCEAPAIGNVYPFGAAQIETLGPDGFDAERENDRCVAVRISLGNTSVILCGDAQEEEERQIAQGWMNADSDVYVADHHGSSSSSTDLFLDAVTPAWAVISCGTGNEHGHPSAAALARLDERGIGLYRTDLQGDISFQMDTEHVMFDKEPTSDRTPGVVSEEEDRSQSVGNDTLSYICNFKSFIFHRPDCETVLKMSEKNKVYSELGRKELISLGYKPCGICDP